MHITFVLPGIYSPNKLAQSRQTCGQMALLELRWSRFPLGEGLGTAVLENKIGLSVFRTMVVMFSVYVRIACQAL